MINAHGVSFKKKDLPKHIAVIMDGNGRWATSRGLKRIEGHRHGADALSKLLDTLLELNIKVVSLYAFSTENWRRPKTEITDLFKLLNEYFRAHIDTMVKKKVKLVVSGDISRLPANTRQIIQNGIEITAKNKLLVANFCINYGSRDEIVRAAQQCAQSVKSGTKLTQKEFEKHLYTAGLPEIDLVIRTAGEKRLSNFLLYQAAYAELYFTDVNWPDFSPEHLRAALIDYQNRTRRFGAVVQHGS